MLPPWFLFSVAGIANDWGGPVLGLGDVAILLPFGGPLVPTGQQTDRFLDGVLEELNDRAYAQQLIPVLEAQHDMKYDPAAHPCSEDIAMYCSDAESRIQCLGSQRQISPDCAAVVRHSVPYVCSELISRNGCSQEPRGVLHCLEELGQSLGEASLCLDSVVATRQALYALQLKKMRKPKPQDSAHSGNCPANWFRAEEGCCVKYWSPTCDIRCARDQCESHDWKWAWLDYRHRPFTCCEPEDSAIQTPHVGKSRRKSDMSVPHAQCPDGFELQADGCCVAQWSWACGDWCLEERCGRHEWAWLGEATEGFRCCSADQVQPHHGGAPGLLDNPTHLLLASAVFSGMLFYLYHNHHRKIL